VLLGEESMKYKPQAGLFDETSRHSRFLEMNITKNCNLDGLKTNLAELVKYSAPNQGLYIQLAFGADLWRKLNPTWSPNELVPFARLTNQSSAKHLIMPATQGDIFIWLHSTDSELIPQVLLKVYRLLEEHGTIQLDLEGIKNKESRDLIGFVDGTANPKEDKRFEAALIPETEKGAGGSYLLTQRWQHNLKAFDQLTISEQEKVVGRTKVEDVELEGDEMPETSHVSRTDAKHKGKAMKIYRRSSPYMASQLDEKGKPDHGLYFLAFSCAMERFTIQLERMLGLSGDHVSDQLMKFSQAQTGSYWFMPNQRDLEACLTVR
jgi:putative iron-dependent peroxidase